MEIVVAENAGFCFGVRRAATEVEKRANEKKGERLFTLGKLIHNDSYVEKLRRMGVDVIGEESLDALAEESTQERPVHIFIRAHGIPLSTEEKLKRLASVFPYFSFTDCTCPFVKKIHTVAENADSEDCVFVLMGTADHPEVIGILSRFRGEKFVFDSPEALENAFLSDSDGILHKKRLIFAAQTTFNLGKWQQSQKFIEKVCTNRQIFDTICSATELRQKEAKTLSESCDTMIVIGGKESSNTAKLAAICRESCADTVCVETADNLSEQIKIPFTRHRAGTHHRVGIVAGASTPDNIIEEVHKTMSEFEELLKESSLKTLNTGDTVTGIVTSVSAAELQLDLGSKVTGRIEADQITDDPSAKLSDMFKVGDEIEAFVIRVSDVDGFATLSKKRVDSDKNWLKIVAAKDNGEILEGKVIEAVKGGVIVLTGASRIFVPASQTGVPKEGNLSSIVGNDVRIKIIEIKDQGKKAIGSIRAVLREERKERESAFWDTLEEGKTFTGKVKSMTSYGAFVDLGGIDGMVHVTELSWKRLKSPADVLKIGDEITVFVKSFDKEAKRISLGYKTEATNPWFLFTSQYAVGDITTVKVVNMMPFGAFAEIIDGVDGLIHISQIAQTRIAKPADVLSIGQMVDVKIIDIDNEKQKVSLSIRALLDDAQAAEEAEAPAEFVAEAPVENA